MTLTLLIDCDGTLIDSEQMHAEASSAVFTTLGLPHWTAEFCRQTFTGTTLSRMLELAREEIHDLPEPELIFRRVDEEKRKREPALRGAEGVLDVLHRLAEGRARLAVVSNGERRSVIDSLNAAGLFHLFSEETIFTKTENMRPKPMPDLYLKAAEYFGARPEECIVLEDSVPGVRAGRAAGMFVLGYTGLAHDPVTVEKELLEAGADAVIERWDSLHDHPKIAVTR